MTPVRSVAGGGRAENRVLYRADLDPVPHPCTTSPGPYRPPALLKSCGVCRFAEHDWTGKKGDATHRVF